MKERDHILLKKQVSGLQEDNERINRLYQVVEKEAFTGKPVMKENQDQVKKEIKKAQEGKWKNVDDEFGTFGRRDNLKMGNAPMDMKTTVKRSDYA